MHRLLPEDQRDDPGQPQRQRSDSGLSKPGYASAAEALLGALEPDFEISAEAMIIREVLFWKLVKQEDGVIEQDAWIGVRDGKLKWQGPFLPTINVLHALGLLEALREQGLVSKLEQAPVGNWKVRLFQFVKAPMGEQWFEREVAGYVDDLLPLAICGAALKLRTGVPEIRPEDVASLVLTPAAGIVE